MRVCSLFAGAGGIDLGLEQAGFSVIWANEQDYDACLTYRQNFPSTTLVRADIRKIDAKTLPDFDLLAAGFPCQPFSIAGKQDGFAHTKGTLFFDICRIIDVKHPAILFLENVSNLVYHDHGRTFAIISEELTRRGYILKYKVMNAKDYGVPQNRNRIYIVGFLDKTAAERFSFPKECPLPYGVSDIIDRSHQLSSEWYLSPDSWQWKTMNQAIRDDSQIYKFHDGAIRQSHGGVSFTLLAGMGYWPDSVPIVRDNWGIRQITPQECFLLQGFPASFDLSKTPVKSAYRQAGNSVCVPVIHQIAEQIIEAVKPIEETVIIGTLRNQRQLDIALSKCFYHFPAVKMPNNMDTIKYAALNLPAFLKDGPGVLYIGRIEGYEIMPRNLIKDLPRESQVPYCLLHVREWKKLPSPVKFKNSPAVFVQSCQKCFPDAIQNIF